MIHRFLGLLGNEHDPFWLPIRGPHPWTPETYCLASSVTERVVARLRLTMVEPFVDRFPGRLGQVGNASAPLDKQRQTCVHFCKCDADCYEGGVAAQVRGLHDDPDVLMGDRSLQRSIQSGYEDCPCQNIPNEFRFARQQAYTNVQRGHFSSHYTVAARHVLPESQATHRTCMKRIYRRVTIDDEAGMAPPAKKPRNAYQLFCRKEGLKVADGLAAYGALSMPERTQLAADVQNDRGNDDEKGREVQQRSVKERMDDAIAVGGSPFGVGSLAYPLSNHHTNAAVMNTKRSCRKWRDLIGVLFGPSKHSRRPCFLSVLRSLWKASVREAFVST